MRRPLTIASIGEPMIELARSVPGANLLLNAAVARANR